MSNSDLLSLVGLAGAFLLLIIAGAAALLPFVIWSIAGSLRGIRHELERLNGGAVAADIRARAAADAIREHAQTGDLAHRLTR